MKKTPIILITIIAVLVLAFFGWYLFLRNPNVPIAETVRGILPFGSGEDINTQFLVDNEQQMMDGEKSLVSDEFGVPTASLFRISNTPVAGFVLLDKNQTIVRYVDRATGHIYDVYLATKASSTSFEKIKVTNNTLPKIYEAYFRSDGNAVILRYLNENSDIAENLSLALTPPQAASTGSPQATSTLYTVSSTAIRGDIGSMAVGSGNTIFSALRDNSSIVLSTFNGTGAKTLLSSAFNNWRLTTVGNNLIVYTKASAGAPGYAYNLSPFNGALTKILGPLNGLVVIPSTFSNQILYSYVENGRTRLFAKNSQNNTPLEIMSETLAEKCVWGVVKVGILFCGTPIDGLRSEEPDNWYRGVTHFSDRIWMFDINTDIAQVMAEPEQTLGVSLDVSEPRLSSGEDFLVFINKTDLSLWALRLEEF